MSHVFRHPNIDELEADLGRATGGDTVKSAFSAALTSSLMFVACASTAVCIAQFYISRLAESSSANVA